MRTFTHLLTYSPARRGLVAAARIPAVRRASFWAVRRLPRRTRVRLGWRLIRS